MMHVKPFSEVTNYFDFQMFREEEQIAEELWIWSQDVGLSPGLPPMLDSHFASLPAKSFQSCLTLQCYGL